MKEILLAILARLASEAATLKYVSADWGQLDYYDTPTPPVQWPCAVVDVLAAQYSNTGELGQLANYTLQVRIADLPLTNSSMQAPTDQREQALSWWSLLEQVHTALHGYIPAEDCTALVRSSGRRLRRDDGVMMWEVLFTFSQTDLSAMPEPETAPRPTLRMLLNNETPEE